MFDLLRESRSTLSMPARSPDGADSVLRHRGDASSPIGGRLAGPSRGPYTCPTVIAREFLAE